MMKVRLMMVRMKRMMRRLTSMATRLVLTQLKLKRTIWTVRHGRSKTQKKLKLKHSYSRSIAHMSKILKGMNSRPSQLNPPKRAHRARKRARHWIFQSLIRSQLKL